MTKEILATKVIPFLVPMSIENGLNLQQVCLYQVYTNLNYSFFFDTVQHCYDADKGNAEQSGRGSSN